MEGSSACSNEKKRKVVNRVGAVRPKTYKSKYNYKVQETENEEQNEPKPASQMGQPEEEDAPVDIQVSSNTSGSEKNNDDDQIDDLISFLKNREEIELDALLESLCEERIEDQNIDPEEDIDEENEKTENTDTFDDNQPIYPGHFLTVRTSVLIIWLMGITHSFTVDQFSATLTLLSLHMINCYPAMKSFYRFKRFFQNMKAPFIKHFYCGFCNSPVSDDNEQCPNEKCGKRLLDDKSKEYFIEMPVKTQLSGLFSRSDFREGLKHRQNKIKLHEDNIEDVYDSSQYKLLSHGGGPLSYENHNNISFTFHTDGVPIFKSSKTSMWPVFLMINELPYGMRKIRDNMLLCGLWFGKEKPQINLLCGPLQNALLELESGVELHLKGDEKINVHGYLYCVSCDTPARSAVLNMNQHNGEFCCPKCMQQGKNFRTVSGGNVRIFPYQEDQPAGPLRNSDMIMENAQEALRTGHVVNGIKGPSFLLFCPLFDPVKNIGIDYMHLIFLGSVRLLIKLWFNVANSLQVFSMYKNIDIVNSRLQSIKPSHFITRPPRSIVDEVKFWKAAELRSWFFYYSIPCIMDLMNPMHFYHYCAFVEAIFLLNQTSISEQDIIKSERLLNYFVFMMPGLYGERYMTINIHSLLHLPSMVRELGPLWSISCFPFESASGDLLKLFHGTQYINIQIVNAVHVFHTLPSLIETIPTSSPAHSFVKSLQKKHHTRNEHFQVYGKNFDKHIDLVTRGKICGMVNKPVDLIKYYKRAVIRGIIYHSEDYTRVNRRNSFTVKFINSKGLPQFGMVKWFGQIFERGEIDLAGPSFACIHVFNFKPTSMFMLHHQNVKPDEYVESNFLQLRLRNIHFVEVSDEICIIPLHHILDLCLNIKHDNHHVICEEPNHYEINL